MITFALILSAFSIIYALIYLSTQLHDRFYHSKLLARVSGALLMISLAYLQWVHFRYVGDLRDSVTGTNYLLSLYLVAPCFYLYTKPFLKDDDGVAWLDLVHLIPFLMIIFFDFEVAFIGSFVIGSLYLLWLMISLIALRKHRMNFHFEFSILSVVLIVALAVIALGLSKTLITEKMFYSLYATSIGLVLVIETTWVTSLSFCTQPNWICVRSKLRFG